MGRQAVLCASLAMSAPINRVCAPRCGVCGGAGRQLGGNRNTTADVSCGSTADSRFADLAAELRSFELDCQ